MPEQQDKKIKWIELKRVNLFLDPEIVLPAKTQALREGISLSKLVDKLLADYLRGQKK